MTTTAIIQITVESTAALICFLIFALLMVGRKTMERSTIHMTELLVIAIFLLISDSLAYYFRGDMSELGLQMTRSSNFLVYTFQFVIMFTVSLYAKSLIEEYGATVSFNYLYAELTCCAVAMLCVMVSQYTGFVYTFDDHNRYVRGPGIYVTMGLGILCVIIHGIMVFRKRRYLPRTVFRNQVWYLTVPFLSIILQTIFYGFSFMNIAIVIVLISMFGIHESVRIKKFEEQTLLLAIQQEQLTEQRIQMVTSQIQPHFLFNALSTISSLCSIDPKTAEKAIDNFADYLRINLDTIGEQKLIPFKTELKHTHTYLWLEQLRFGDDLKIEYDIQADDFMIPPLVLQPVVENAVKHGICKKEDGGTVTIKVTRENGEIKILVADDGAGFDTSKPLSKDKTHVGINNVKHRLATLCGGSLTIESAPGAGTRATILIKEDILNEHIAG